MLRILHGLCQFPRGVRKPFSGFRLFSLACCLYASTGCGSERLNVTAGSSTQQDKKPQRVSGAFKPADITANSTVGSSSEDTAQHVTSAAEADRPSVSRLQKPDNEPARRSTNASILDLASYQVPGPSNGEIAAQIRATVYGVAILDEEVREAVYPYLMVTTALPEPERSRLRKEAFEKELQQLIEREVVLHSALARLKDRPQVVEKLKEAAGKEFDRKIRKLRENAHIKTDEEFKAFLRVQGLSLEGLRRQVERNFMAMEYMKNLIVPNIDRISFEQIAEYYQQHPEEFQIADSATWQDIFIDAGKFPSREAALQFAEQLVAKARAGEDFLKLSAQYDKGGSYEYRKGEGVGRRRGEIRPAEAEPILFQMRDGQIGPLVPLTNGFHVIRLVKRERAGLKPFDEKTQAAIKSKLQNEVWEREQKRILADLKREAKDSIQISAKAP